VSAYRNGDPRGGLKLRFHAALVLQSPNFSEQSQQSQRVSSTSRETVGARATSAASVRRLQDAMSLGNAPLEEFVVRAQRIKPPKK
jgi:hypothetical protein